MDNDSQNIYKLRLLKPINKDLGEVIRNEAANTLFNYSLEGSKLPAVNTRSLANKNYSRNDISGKYIVCKFWFIHCVACVAEFPELNKLVDRYADRPDVRFVSFALDPEKQLDSFLTIMPFKYDVLPRMRKYIFEKLNLSRFPTHMLVDKDGKILRVPNSIEDLEPLIHE